MLKFRYGKCPDRFKGAAWPIKGAAFSDIARTHPKPGLEHSLGRSCPAHTCPLSCHRKPRSASCPGWRASSVFARHTKIKGRWTGLSSDKAAAGTCRPPRGQRDGSEAPSDSTDGPWEPASGSSHCHTSNRLVRHRSFLR